MKLYRDCYTGVPPFDDPIYVSIYDSLENLLIQFQIDLPTTDTLDNNTYNVCLFPPPNVCVEEAVYTADYFLPPGKYYMTYQRCCRNDSIVNMFNPLGQGAGWDITIPDTAIAICNSSPYYNQYPPTIICLDSQFVYDHSATDPDGDSLVYYLCTPNDYDNGIWGIIPNPSGPPSSNFDITYVSPYGSTYPIYAPVDSFKIDSQTGLLTGTPTQAGRYVVGVCVSEYRNGVLLSTNKRDFQFNVAQCVEEVVAGFTADSPACDDLTVNFTNTSNKAAYYFWDFGVGADSIFADTSSEETPTFTYPEFGNYTVMLIVNAGLSCADTATFNVYLYNSPVADAGEDALISLGNSIVVGGDITASGGTSPYTYVWTPGVYLDDSTIANPTATPDSIITYAITVTDANGCIGEDTIVVDIALGIGELSNNENINIYPNPTTGQFTINVSTLLNMTNVSIKLYQITGQQIYAKDLLNLQDLVNLSIDLSNYAKGMYYVQVVTGDSVFTRKVVYQ